MLPKGTAVNHDGEEAWKQRKQKPNPKFHLLVSHLQCPAYTASGSALSPKPFNLFQSNCLFCHSRVFLAHQKWPNAQKMDGNIHRLVVVRSIKRKLFLQIEAILEAHFANQWVRLRIWFCFCAFDVSQWNSVQFSNRFSPATHHCVVHHFSHLVMLILEAKNYFIIDELHQKKATFCIQVSFISDC